MKRLYLTLKRTHHTYTVTTFQSSITVLRYPTHTTTHKRRKTNHIRQIKQWACTANYVQNNYGCSFSESIPTLWAKQRVTQRYTSWRASQRTGQTDRQTHCDIKQHIQHGALDDFAALRKKLTGTLNVNKNKLLTPCNEVLV